MVMELISPKDRVFTPKVPSRIVLDMAFAVGAGPELGDKSRYRSHGAIVGADWANGLHGRCLNFNAAIPDYVEIPATHTQLNFIAQDFSGVARIYPNEIDAVQRVFNRGLVNDDGWLWALYLTGTFRVFTFQNLALQNTATRDNSVILNAWNTIGFSRDGASVRVYVNGVDVTNPAVTGVHINPETCARSAKIAIYDDLATFAYDGLIEFLRIFRGVALTASEHLAYHRALA